MTLNAKTFISKNKYFKIKQVEYSDLKDWKQDNLLLALKSFIKSCNIIAKMNGSKLLNGDLYDIKVNDLRKVCDIANIIAGTTDEDAKIFFENWFTPFLLIDLNNGKKTNFKGYHEASINGSRIQTDIYRYPVYKRPNDLTNKPYFTRKEINDGALNNYNIELFYTDNKFDLQLLELKGFGRVNFDNGTVSKIVYDGNNNRKYTSIKDILIQNKYIKRKKANLKNIKQWFLDNPNMIDDILNQNESYTFFKEKNDDYIRGIHGSILTPFRSIAINADLLPYGFPFWIETKIKNKKENFNKLVISQDMITIQNGISNVEIFFGTDKKAEELSLETDFNGIYYILIPNNIVKNL